jgi:RNA recognition motif-containing protein
MNSKLYVGNLSFQTTDAGLRETFGQFGTITDVYLASDKITGRPRGFAFVTFSTDEEAKLAVEKLHGTDLDGRNLSVSEARPREEMGANRRSGGSQRY